MITITDSLKKRVQDQRTKQGDDGLYLRVMVESGGCSGFQYTFSWDKNVAPDDATYDDCVVVDDVSLPYLQDAVIDFMVTLMGSDFKVTNPNAVSGCGCGHSFAV